MSSKTKLISHIEDVMLTKIFKIMNDYDIDIIRLGESFRKLTKLEQKKIIESENSIIHKTESNLLSYSDNLYFKYNSLNLSGSIVINKNKTLEYKKPFALLEGVNDNDKIIIDLKNFRKNVSKVCRLLAGKTNERNNEPNINEGLILINFSKMLFSNILNLEEEIMLLKETVFSIDSNLRVKKIIIEKKL